MIPVTAKKNLIIPCCQQGCVQSAGHLQWGTAAICGPVKGSQLFWTNGDLVKSFEGSEGNLKCNTT